MAPQRMNLNDLGDPLTLHLAPPAGETFYLSWGISQHFQHGLAQNTDIHCSRALNPTDNTDFLTFPLFLDLSEMS